MSRKKQIKSVMDRLNERFANPVKAKAGDEWPTPTQEEVSSFAELVYDIANLAFDPDYKERSVLDIRIVDKKRYNMMDFYVPKDIDLYDRNLSEADFFRAFSDATRTATRMISQGQEMLDRFADIASFRASTLKKAEETKNDFDGLRKLIDENDLKAARAEIERLVEKYDPPKFVGTGEAAKTPYNRHGNYRSIPEELQLLIDDYGVQLQRSGETAEIDAAIADLMPMLDVATPLIGKDHRSNDGYEGSFDEAIGAAREGIYKYQYTLGKRVLQPVVVRYNRLSNEHRGICTMRERGLKVEVTPA